MSFFDLEVLKEKSINSKGIMAHLKLLKNMLSRKKLKKKINNSYGLMKNGQIFTIQKSLTTKRSRFSKKIFFIWVSHLLLHYILSSNNKFDI
jgi:hypothetical protein